VDITGYQRQEVTPLLLPTSGPNAVIFPIHGWVALFFTQSLNKLHFSFIRCRYTGIHRFNLLGPLGFRSRLLSVDLLIWRKKSMKIKELSRRDFTRLSGISAVALLTSGGLTSLLSSCAAPEAILAGTAIPAATIADGASGRFPDVEIALKATSAEAQILSGKQTCVWQHQVIERQIDPNFSAAWETLSDGFVDEGWHDTGLVMPGEHVKVLLKFEDFEGLYLYHCHNLEHEDMGMMRNYHVEA
jgi:hypothetical protein